MGLLGPVKTVRTELTKSGEAPAGMLTMEGYSVIEVSFDEKGMKQFQRCGLRYPSEDSWTDSMSYVYDHNGACTEYQYYDIAVYVDGSWTSDKVYGVGSVTKDDESGRQVETTRFTSEGTLLYVWKTTYDSISNVADEIGYDSTGRVTSPCFKYKYDLNANLIEEMKLTDDQRVTSRKTFYYDKNNYLERYESYSGNSTSPGVTLWYENNLLSIVIYLNDNGTAWEKSVFTYLFDAAGNWIAQTQTFDDSRQTVIERKITYRDQE